MSAGALPFDVAAGGYPSGRLPTMEEIILSMTEEQASYAEALTDPKVFDAYVASTWKKGSIT